MWTYAWAQVAVTRGCIPVIVQDGIRVEWEENLPVHEYSVRIPMWLAHKTDKVWSAGCALDGCAWLFAGC